MNVRVEVGAERLDGCDAFLTQQILQLRINQLDAFAIRIAAVGGGRGVNGTTDFALARYLGG